MRRSHPIDTSRVGRGTTQVYPCPAAIRSMNQIDSVLEVDVMDPETILYRMQHQRGPMPGQGRGSGQAYRGIVEETPALWIAWIAAAYRRMGTAVPEQIFIDGLAVQLDYAEQTFGRRYYFLCPTCGHRRETLGDGCGRGSVRPGSAPRGHIPGGVPVADGGTFDGGTGRDGTIALASPAGPELPESVQQQHHHHLCRA